MWTERLADPRLFDRQEVVGTMRAMPWCYVFTPPEPGGDIGTQVTQDPT